MFINVQETTSKLRVLRVRVRVEIRKEGRQHVQRNPSTVAISDSDIGKFDFDHAANPRPSLKTNSSAMASWSAPATLSASGSPVWSCAYLQKCSTNNEHS